MHLALEAVRAKGSQNFVGGAGTSFDLHSSATPSKPDPPAPRVRFRMKVSHEDIGSDFSHAAQFARHRFQVLNMSHGKGADRQVNAVARERKTFAIRSGKASSDRRFLSCNSQHRAGAIDPHA